jgi:hypothetical protein
MFVGAEPTLAENGSRIPHSENGPAFAAKTGFFVRHRVGGKADSAADGLQYAAGFSARGDQEDQGVRNQVRRRSADQTALLLAAPLKEK